MFCSKKFFTLRAISHWNNIPRDVAESLPLQVFKMLLDRVLGNLIYTPFSHKRFDIMIFQGYFHSGLLYDSMKLFEGMKKALKLTYLASIAVILKSSYKACSNWKACVGSIDLPVFNDILHNSHFDLGGKGMGLSSKLDGGQCLIERQPIHCWIEQ